MAGARISLSPGRPVNDLYRPAAEARCVPEKHNVVLIVLDTLREDRAAGLQALQDSGFVRYSGAISTSPWTLPAHVSMFTGALPSVHSVHAAPGVYMGNMMGPSRSGLEASRGDVLRKMGDAGYTRYCYSCNPLITPRFGFAFDWHREYRAMIEMTEVRESLPPGRAGGSRAGALLKEGKVSLLGKLAGRKARMSVDRALNRPVLDKGSRRALKDLKAADPRPPFFIYLNVMEAHEPYHWGEPNDATRLSMLGRKVPPMGWEESYDRNAGIATKRALEAVDALKGFDPLVVVTSDHGQLLGEGGRYGHGYFLDSELLRVPLYVKYPSGAEPVQQSGPMVSLAQLQSLMSWGVDGAPAKLGSTEAVAESFGPHFDLSPYLPGDEGKAEFARMYVTRRRVYSGTGSLVYDATGHSVESVEGDLDEGERGRLARIAEGMGEPSTPEVGAISEAEEKELTERLSKLGYV